MREDEDVERVATLRGAESDEIRLTYLALYVSLTFSALTLIDNDNGHRMTERQ